MAKNCSFLQDVHIGSGVNSDSNSMGTGFLSLVVISEWILFCIKPFHINCPCTSYIRGDRPDTIVVRKRKGIPGNRSSIPGRDGDFYVIHTFRNLSGAHSAF
jgi:hypothetical protein